MLFGSVFTGIGGLDLGLEQAGHRVAFQCEIDEYRRSILQRHWPNVPRHDDVRTLTAEPVEMLAGGFPCQDVSQAGRRRGLAGERSGLFFEFARLAGELVVPDGWALIENVPGLLTSNGRRDMGTVLATLAELGFRDLAYRVLDSRFFGVAQRRRRLYILARRASGRRACEVLLEPEGRGRDLAALREKGTASAATLGQGLAGPLGGAARLRGGRTTDIDGHGAYVSGSVSDGATAALPLTAGTRLDAAVENFVAGEESVRRLTPTEWERLQGFPDGWSIPYESVVRDPPPDSRRYAAIGDAVTVPVARWIGERLMRCRGSEK